MQLIFKNNNEKTIYETERLNFSGPSSLYLIAVVARSKHKKQDPNLVDHESLSLQLDTHRYASSFQGNKLKNLSQTVYILTQLQGQTHTLILTTGTKQKTATVQSVYIYSLRPDEEFALVRDNTAEDGNRRPWITIILDNLPLLSFTPTIEYTRRKRDSDDVKVKIDGKEQLNLLKSVKHFLWRFAGSLLSWTNPIKIESEAFQVNLPQGLHTIEFEADRMPTLKSISLSLGTLPPIPKRIPTVDDPTWTGDFTDDGDEMLLARLVFGEARSRSKQEKIAIAWVIKNRLHTAIRDFGFSYHEIILKNDGVTYQFSPMNPKETDNFSLLIDPLKFNNQVDKIAWQDSYEIVTGVIAGKITDPTSGAVFFHSEDFSKDDFLRNTPRAVYSTSIGVFLFYTLQQ